jgi:hypothetical protein
VSAPRRFLDGGIRGPRPPVRAAEPGRELGLGDNPLDEVGAPEVTDREPVSVTSEANALYESTPPTQAQEALPAAKKTRARVRQPLPDGRTFRLVTFSFYEEDVARLDALLESARHKGHRGASRSQIVRLALRQFALDALPDDC